MRKELMLTGCRRVGVALVFRLIIASIRLFLTQVISGMCRAPWDQGSRRCTVDSDMEVGRCDAGGSLRLATVDLVDGVAVEEMPEDVGDFEVVAAGFFVQAQSPSSLVPDQNSLGVEVQVPEEEAMDCPGVVESLVASS